MQTSTQICDISTPSTLMSLDIVPVKRQMHRLVQWDNMSEVSIEEKLISTYGAYSIKGSLRERHQTEKGFESRSWSELCFGICIAENNQSLVLGDLICSQCKSFWFRFIFALFVSQPTPSQNSTMTPTLHLVFANNDDIQSNQEFEQMTFKICHHSLWTQFLTIKNENDKWCAQYQNLSEQRTNGFDKQAFLKKSRLFVAKICGNNYLK
jgi:hypothetical protein